MASNRQVQLIASGDLRLSANQNCWAAQQEMEQRLTAAVAAAGYEVVRAHPYKPEVRHGFIASQREGIEVFKQIDPGRAPHRGRSRLAILAPRSGRADHASRSDSHGRQLVGHVARAGRHAQPQRLAHQGRRRLLDAVERRLYRRLLYRRGCAIGSTTGKCSHDVSHVKPLERRRNSIRRPRNSARSLPGSSCARRPSWACSTKAAWGCSTRSCPTTCCIAPACSRSG